MDRQTITGLILAGGRGSRMGGIDKGLQIWRDMPLVQHAVQRLAPQVGPVIISANRNLGAYGLLGAPVWPDQISDFPGPLAGFLAGLSHCDTPWMVTVPCDVPRFPEDLVMRLAAAIEHEQTGIAVACSLEDGHKQSQPTFCLMRREVRENLAAFLQAGGRQIDRWTREYGCTYVLFDRHQDTDAFFNINTETDLQR